MCQRRQNSAIERAKYGLLKFCVNGTPKRRAEPIAMSVYPEKSKYTWNAYRYVAPIKSRPLSSVIETPLSTAISTVRSGRVLRKGFFQKTPNLDRQQRRCSTLCSRPKNDREG